MTATEIEELVAGVVLSDAELRRAFWAVHERAFDHLRACDADRFACQFRCDEGAKLWAEVTRLDALRALQGDGASLKEVG